MMRAEEEFFGIEDPGVIASSWENLLTLEINRVLLNVSVSDLSNFHESEQLRELVNRYPDSLGIYFQRGQKNYDHTDFVIRKCCARGTLDVIPALVKIGISCGGKYARCCGEDICEYGLMSASIAAKQTTVFKHFLEQAGYESLWRESKWTEGEAVETKLLMDFLCTRNLFCLEVILDTAAKLFGENCVFVGSRGQKLCSLLSKRYENEKDNVMPIMTKYLEKISFDDDVSSFWWATNDIADEHGWLGSNLHFVLIKTHANLV
ncbi:predicted protein [Chaetoceros tenuissimus]|uniref:Uncharacterized protein n=1 Tax=Chaetoceros tenuissimus TaxID=426638 RepID=A0AAD3D3K8_9STRA|nr:predicted protein [Chaetoceros tenuissimus]